MISTPGNGCFLRVRDVVQCGIYIDVVIASPLHLGEMNFCSHISIVVKFDLLSSESVLLSYVSRKLTFCHVIFENDNCLFDFDCKNTTICRNMQAIICENNLYFFVLFQIVSTKASFACKL